MRNQYMAKVLVYNKLVTEDQINAYKDKVSDSKDIGQVLVEVGLLKPALYQKVLAYVRDLEAKNAQAETAAAANAAAIAAAKEREAAKAKEQAKEQAKAQATPPAKKAAANEAPSAPASSSQGELQIEGNDIYGKSSISAKEVKAVAGLESTQLAEFKPTMQESEPEAPAAPAVAEEPAKALPTHFAVESGEGAPVQAPESLSPTTSLAEMIAFARKFNATDIYLYPDRQVAMRQSGNIVPVTEEAMSVSELSNRLDDVADCFDDGYKIVQGENFSKTAGVPGVGRIRLSVTWFEGVPSVSIRIIQAESASLESLYLPPFCESFAELTSGLVLIAGPSFSGRTTTMLTYAETIMRNRETYIQTVEKPIERLLRNTAGAVAQREVGLHVHSGVEGIELAMNNGADVILFDHLENMDELSLLLQASNAGALVFAVTTGNNIHALLSRLLASVPEVSRTNFAYTLAEQLKGVIVQQLVPVVQNQGLILACEAMKVSSTVANMIRKNDFSQIAAAISSQHDQGITLDDSLQKCVESGYIDGFEAWKRAYDNRRFASYRPAK
ncbi:ATPase, T2SS/T4P/T4SS family [uncultured Fibrobacter sp.]|uniref:type IV pilus twitching motility protein PilT n=1 Tax=uncultured Fibrobacter sp. TaxID=261512 RepID=UPI002608C375|nr:ATPase, T2SS/T4P/T4SS family [uncultured Fibrobacter sp.]